MNRKSLELLKNREFVSVASCDLERRPNAAPKFVLKVEHHFVYLVDYSVGRTSRNLAVNPRISISFMDNDTLMGYQLNGSVEIISKGQAYDALVKDIAQRELELSTQRIIEGVTKGKSHGGFELSLSEKFVIFKARVEEIIEIASSGTLKTEKVCE